MKNSKVLCVSDLARVLRGLQNNGKKVVFTNGCFDLIHAGHVRYLRKARSLGDVLVVGVNTDASVRKLKGAGRPLAVLAHRLEVLSALEPVDYLVSFPEDTPARLICDVRPDILVKGADYRQAQIAGADSVKKMGGRVVRIVLAKGLSTTDIVKKIIKNAGCCA